MFIAPIVLALLIISTPVTLIVDGPIVHGLVTAAAATSVASIALQFRPGEAQFLSLLIRPAAIIAACPALWMVFQVLPLNSVGLANPIWESAATALGHSLAGSISIDPGATLISLARYLSFVAIAFVSAALTIDRQRAQACLYLLTAIVSLIALIVLAIVLGGFTFPSNSGGKPVINAATDISCLGVILATATALHAFETLERRKLQKPDQSGSAVWSRLIFVGSSVAVVISFLAVAVAATAEAYFAVTCGCAALFAAILIRRFRLGPWGYSAIASIALVVAVGIVVPLHGFQKVDLTLAFAVRAPAPLIALTQRTLTETAWWGTGAGTYAAALPIYRGISELTAGPLAPTAAANIAVELGRPFFWAVLAAAMALFITFLSRALKRHRDSFYSIAGAGCIMTISLLAFTNISVLSTPVLVVTSAVIGLAIAQSKSRSA